jgi:xanthine dehydrogenase accessory factor
MKPLILIRGGGDLGSGVAVRLHRIGFQIIIIELETPLAIRRTVSFSEAIYEGVQTIEDITARLVSPDQLQVTMEAGEIPIMADPDANTLRNQFLTSPQSTIVIDARLLKTEPEVLPIDVPLHIGLGPGFTAGENCHAVIETRRGHTLGRVCWDGTALADSGKPDGDPRRVLRATNNGNLIAHLSIGDQIKEGDLVAEIQPSEGENSQVISSIAGVLRGIIRPGIEVSEGMKIADVDPRNDPSACLLVSDKALAVAGGVMEAVFTYIRTIED